MSMELQKRIGMITIGQSPRVDLVPEMKEILGPEVEVLESGALDGLSLDEVKRFSPRKGDDIICTRMSDGTEVVIARRFVLPRVQKCIDLLSDRSADILLILCTGRFPKFSSERPLIKSQEVLDHFIMAVHEENKRIGMLIPVADQTNQMKKRYKRLKGEIIIKAASPYAREDEVSVAAEELKKEDPHLVVMHCMGYTLGMKKKMVEITGKPAVLARSVVARTLKELVS